MQPIYNEQDRRASVIQVAGDLVFRANRAAFARGRDLHEMLRVLVVLAAPVMSQRPGAPPPPRLDLRAEWKKLADAVRRSNAPIALIRLTPPTLDALRYALSSRAHEQNLLPQVVHFSGHGWREGLLFEDEYGRAAPAPTAALVELFAEAGAPLAVFNACETAHSAASVAQALVQAGALQAAVGHREPVLDPTAIQFAARLYAELAQGGATLGEAMQRARRAIAAQPDAYNPLAFGDQDLSLPAPQGGEPLIHDSRSPGALRGGAEAFFGRGAELVDLARKLDQDMGRVLVLNGVAGIGKSALAVESAHRNAWRFPGGVSSAVGPRTPDTAASARTDDLLNELAQGLELSLQPGQSPTVALQAHCGRVPTLLILDNLELLARHNPPEFQRLVSFLEHLPAPSRALVTLRPPLPALQELPQAIPLPLTEGLDANPATAYARHVARAKGLRKLIQDPEASAEIARRLSGHPKMIEVAVAGARRPGGYRALRERLKTLSGDLGQKLEELVGWSAETLGQPGQAALARLPLFPAASCRAESLQAALQTDPLPGLDELFDAGLCAYDPESERYAWHQTVMKYAQAHAPLPTAESAAARLRLVEHYAQWIDEVGGENYDALSVEHLNLWAALEWAEVGWLEQGSPDDERRAWGHALLELARSLDHYFNLRGFWDAGEHWLSLALEVSQALDKRQREAYITHALGTLCANQGALQRARELYEHSATLKRELGDELGLAATLHELGCLAQDTSDDTAAHEFYQRSRQINEQLGNQRGLAANLHALGSLAQDRGDYTAAYDFYQQSADINKQLGNQRGRAANLHALGSIAQTIGNYPAAYRFYQQSRHINEQLGNPIGWAQTTFVLGLLAWQEEDAEQASALWKQVLAVFERHGVEEVMAQRGAPVREVLEQARAGRTAQEWLALRQGGEKEK